MASLEGARLVFVVNVDWFFLSHRLPIARAAQNAGAEVVVAAAGSGAAEMICREGFGFVPIPISRKGINPFYEVRTLASLIRLYHRLRPDLVHHVTIKPVLYGSLAGRLVDHMAVVNAISGLGWTFSSNLKRASVLRPLVKALYLSALRYPRSRTIFQNPDDRDRFVRLGLVRQEQAVLIRGSGVDYSRFRATPEPEGDPIVMLPSRMLWDKGVGEFVKVARLVRATHPRVRFVLVGATDENSSTAVPVSQLKAWVREGAVEWWGHQEDMPAILSQANIVVLPTVREGLPKVLLEAAASARAIVATDEPGCREIVRHGVNGFLVPLYDTATLARFVRGLLRSPELREKFGRAGREIAVAEFGEERVVEQTLDLYRELLGESSC